MAGLHRLIVVIRQATDPRPAVPETLVTAIAL
jgi:hypothetical protein